MKNQQSITDEIFDSFTWSLEEEQNNIILFYPKEDENLFCRYNSYKEVFEDRNFNPNGYQTEQLQALLANYMADQQNAFNGFDGYSEYGVNPSDFLS
jgi:hypothetical protein